MKRLSQIVGFATSHISQRIPQLWQNLQPQRWVSIAFVGLFLLASSVDSSGLKQSTKDTVNDLITRGDNGRPATTRQWQNENESLKGKPGQRAERITKESADAVGKMGKIYPENVKTLLPDAENSPLGRND
jgi:hypothetical protein